MTQNTQAALFSAIITAFLIAALSNLGPNYQQQSALLLYQLLNGLDPKLASMSDPTAPFQPSSLTIAVSCLWSASLSASLGASFIAVICKEWLAEYNGGTNVAVDLIQACWRQHRFLILHKLKIPFIISLLPPLLHSSVILFFTGAIIYFWQIDVRVAVVYLVIGGIFGISYFIWTFLPIAMKSPFRPYSTQLAHKFSVTVGESIIWIANGFTHYLLNPRYAIDKVVRLLPQAIFSQNVLGAPTTPPTKQNPLRAWWPDPSSDSPHEADTSQRAQEEAILWLSQMPLDQSDSKAVVSSLALISRPREFSKSMVTFVYFALDSWLREDPDKREPDPAINCIILLGHIKYQLVVDGNLDEDHNIAGITVTPYVAWEAQRLVDDDFEGTLDTPYSEETRARLLTAAAWLSPVDETEEMPEGEGPERAADGVTQGTKKLEVQNRRKFIQKIKATFGRHFSGENPLDNSVLIDLIHGMHASIPRENNRNTPSIISLLPFCKDYHSPWSEDESVLKALITYALDLLLPRGGRRPLVDREIKFGELASELIDVLMAGYAYTDVVTFGFWLIYRVPYAFRSRKSMLEDIPQIWASTNEAIPEVHRKRMTFRAVDAFVAVAQCHLAAKEKLPKFSPRGALNLLTAALEDDLSRPMATYAVAMILNLGSSTPAAAFATEINAESFTNTLRAPRSYLEANAAEEDTLDLHIYSTLALLKLRQPGVDVYMVRTLIREMETTIKNPVVRDAEFTTASQSEMNVRWKAIYLSGLLFKLLRPGDWEGNLFRDSVRTLVLNGELPLADDYARCIGPLGMDSSRLGDLAAWQWPRRSVFEEWIHKFPLFPLVGSKIRGEHRPLGFRNFRC